MLCRAMDFVRAQALISNKMQTGQSTKQQVWNVVYGESWEFAYAFLKFILKYIPKFFLSQQVAIS